jgi:hypothetical protein
MTQTSVRASCVQVYIRTENLRNRNLPLRKLLRKEVEGCKGGQITKNGEENVKIEMEETKGEAS